MPTYPNPDYRRPWMLPNGHLETIYPALLRKIKSPPVSTRHRIDTPDGDFLDLDWVNRGSKKLVIVQHGLEGSSERAYMVGMAKIFVEHGFDTCLWNFRGCSGELNRKPIFYHSGATYDLSTVVNHFEKDYEEIYLIGFSLGGNLTLRYLGEDTPSKKIKKAVVFSVPLDLEAGANNLMTPSCYIYEKRFLVNLERKVRQKAALMPDEIDLAPFSKTKTLRDFDEYFTAPLHGFSTAMDYYQNCSSKFVLDGIRIPTLIVNALNDPLLTPECIDPKLAENLPNVILELTSTGGHVGFSDFTKPYYWSEYRALKFIQEDISI